MEPGRGELRTIQSAEMSGTLLQTPCTLIKDLRCIIITFKLCTTFIVEASRDALDTESRNPGPDREEGSSIMEVGFLR